MGQPRITVSMPCYGRPRRTIRAIECIAKQTINNWEAWIVGDCCPFFQEIFESEWYQDLWKEMTDKGNIIRSFNCDHNNGGHGYAITNNNIRYATGKYFCFFANDDIITPDHFENYLGAIEDTTMDWVFLDSEIVPDGRIRYPHVEFGKIGHSEIIARTEFLRAMPPHSPAYGHDFELIQEMAARGVYKYAGDRPATYKVMRIGDRCADAID